MNSIHVVSNKFTYLILLHLLCPSSTLLTLKIGGLFDSKNLRQAAALEVGVDIANSNKDFRSVKLVAENQPILPSNALNVTDSVCELFTRGVVGIVGPSLIDVSPYVQVLCDRKEIPHIETHWDNKGGHDNCLVNMYPHPKILSQVYVDVVLGLGWLQFTVIYEDNESLGRVIGLLSMYDQNGHTIVLRQLKMDEVFGYRGMLNGLKKSGERFFVLDCRLEVLETVLEQMQQVGLLTENYYYFVTNLDLHIINLEPFQFGGANITGLSFVNRDYERLGDIEEKLSYVSEKAEKLSVDSALIIDSVQLFHETLRDHALSKPLYKVDALHCNASDNWEFGYTLINYMKTKTIKGLTGVVKFDTEGFRSDFSMDVMELTTQGLVKVGNWNASYGYVEKRVFMENKIEREVDEYTLKGKEFVVITCLTPPYGMLKETTTKLSGNDRFEGFCIDLIHELSQLLGFSYTFVVQEDGNNGNLDRTTGHWDGMIKEIIDERADLAITDLTITSERESAVDFTMPFMNLGISILYRKPEPVPPSLFMFSSPFSLEVWFFLGVAYFSVSICLFFMGRLSPSEWTNPYPCVDEPAYLVNQFSLRNSLWFTIGSLMQQGSEVAPIGISTRMTAGVWWFFTLIMVSSYTANLSAFLTVETLVTPFKNVDELANQKEVKYGAKHGGATANYFRDSNISSYKKIWRYMSDNPHVMTADNLEGVTRVKTENYAFLMESTSIEYITERNCSLAQVGDLLDDKGYGIAMRKDSPYRNALSQAILKLQESGALTSLKIKWWKEERGGGNCVGSGSESQSTPLSLQNVGGVFLVLSVGSILALICTVVQLCINTYKLARKENISFKEELFKELKFTVDIRKTQRPVKISSNIFVNNVVIKTHN